MAPVTVDFAPVTRVAGGLDFHMVIDRETGQVGEAAASGTLFRGYEVLLEGRDARDAIFISSRACGVCGGAHSTAAALALEMICTVPPPPFGIVARNLLSALEDLIDLPVALFVRAGPDYSEPVVRATNPELWERAELAAAPGRATHGFARIADIMSALTSMSGELYREALVRSRTAAEGYGISGGKYPHPQTMVPSGVSSTIDANDLNVTHLRIVEFFDYGRRVTAVWDDLVEFLLEAEPRFAEVGAGPSNFLDLGRWDDPLAYDAVYENAGAWGERRWATPGAIVGGRLRTTDLRQLDAGIEEFVDHSFYEDWTGDRGAVTTPGERRLPRHHPLDKATLPAPADPDWRGKYSWCTAPRWDGHAMETGVHARMAVTALARKLPGQQFAEATGHGLKLAIPQGEMPANVIEWHVPTAWHALERHRARAYALVHSSLVAYENLLLGYDLGRFGGPDARVFSPYKIPGDERVGVGFWGGGRGAISHHLAIDGGVIGGHQIVSGSTWAASPRDGRGQAGPLEQAVLGTPLLSSRERERCVDVLRAIHSLDPCMACAAH